MSLYLKFFINGVTFVPFHYDIEASSSQLKRFNDSVIDPESLLKIEATFCLITFYPFQTTLNFLVYYYFYLRSISGSNAFQNGLELQSTLSFSKCCHSDYIFRFSNRFCCHLNLTKSLGFFDLFALILRYDQIIICFQRFVLK